MQAVSTAETGTAFVLWLSDPTNRFYLTDEQKILLAKTFGCVRYV